MVMVVVMVWSMMVMAGGVVMTVPSVMSARSRASEYKTGHCNGRKHYCHFLVHVFLLFLSLSTMH